MSSARKPSLMRYRYDALDRLVSHVQLGDPECHRFYCDSHLVTEVGGYEQLSIIRHEDHLLAQQGRKAGGVDTALLASDQQRSVLGTVQKNLQRSIAYTAYGHRLSENGLISLLGFTGQRAEPVTGHYLLGNGYRAFNPALMRFNSPDGLSPFGNGGLNAYAYCAGDPVNWIDPTGSSKFSALKSLFGFKSQLPFSTPFQRMRVKPVRNVLRLSESVVMFEDTTKNGLRATFQTHGGLNYGVVWRDGLEVDSRQFYNMALNQGVDFNKYADLRVVACWSGEDRLFSISFAERLANISGVTTKGYIGMVRSTKSTQILNKLRVGEVSNRSHYFGVLKNDSRRRWEFGLFDNPYHPVKFDPDPDAISIRSSL